MSQYTRRFLLSYFWISRYISLNRPMLLLMVACSCSRRQLNLSFSYKFWILYSLVYGLSDASSYLRYGSWQKQQLILLIWDLCCAEIVAMFVESPHLLLHYISFHSIIRILLCCSYKELTIHQLLHKGSQCLFYNAPVPMMVSYLKLFLHSCIIYYFTKFNTISRLHVFICVHYHGTSLGEGTNISSGFRMFICISALKQSVLDFLSHVFN